MSRSRAQRQEIAPFLKQANLYFEHRQSITESKEESVKRGQGCHSRARSNTVFVAVGIQSYFSLPTFKTKHHPRFVLFLQVIATYGFLNGETEAHSWSDPSGRSLFSCEVSTASWFPSQPLALPTATWGWRPLPAPQGLW